LDINIYQALLKNNYFMIKKYLSFLTLLLIASAPVFSQTTLFTGFTNNNGSGTVTFNLENTNNYDVIITSIEGVVGTSGTTTAGMWYKTTPISGSPGNISSANGWTLAASGTFTGVSTSSNNTQVFLSNLTFILPANTTYGMAVCAYSGSSGRQRYSTISGNPNISAGGVILHTGVGIGYGGGVPPATPGNSPRGWIGKITFMPACEGPSNLNATNITTTDADISWNAVAGSLGYEYVLDQSSASPSGPGTATTATTYHASGLMLNTTYYFHIRNQCANSFSNWTTYSFTSADAYCKPPVNILYSNLTSTSVDVLWSSMPTSDGYEYYVDVNPSLPTSTTGVTYTTSITANLNNLTPVTKYYFFIRSICLGGKDNSTWRIDSFVTDNTCPAPMVAVQNITANSADAFWPAVPTAISYEYVVTTSETKPAFGKETFNTSATVTIDENEKTQYLHVRTKCNSQFSFSEWTTEMLKNETTSVVNANAFYAVDIYPNPVQDNLIIAGAAKADIIVRDAKGMTVIQARSDNDKFVIDCSKLPSGIYLIDIKGEHVSQVSRFTRK
jgi:hypothetical protein